MRKLARIELIKSIDTIPGADRIELVTVQSWKVVSEKGLHKVGDEVVYCEIDAMLPVRPEFEFLRKGCFKKMADGSEGFRLKTIRLRGQFSQGLILPKSILGELKDNFKVGDEVTQELGIVKYEEPIPACLAGEVKGMFPSFMPKTDEERIQNFTNEYEEFKTHSYYVTEKLDGTSATFYFKDGEFGVCSRGLNLLETEGNSFWRVARNLDIENKLKSVGKNIAIQGELIGEGIQKNRYLLRGQTLRLFNVFDINAYERYIFEDFVKFANEMNIQTVPILDENFTLPNSIDDLVSMADGKSILNQKANREGIVIRSIDKSRISFKVISNKFLEKED